MPTSKGLDFDACLAAAAGVHAEVWALEDLCWPEGSGYYTFWDDARSGPMRSPDPAAVERVRRALTPRVGALPPDARLRDLNTSDLSYLEALSPGLTRWPEACIELQSARGSRGAIVCEFAQALAGFGRFRHFDQRKHFGRPQLRWIEVLEPYRRRGIGGAILRELERRCRRDRLETEPIPESTTDLRRFLRAYGYHARGMTVDFDGGEMIGEPRRTYSRFFPRSEL